MAAPRPPPASTSTGSSDSPLPATAPAPAPSLNTPPVASSTAASTPAAQPPSAPPARFSLDGLRRSLSLPASHPAHSPSERPVGHSARVLYALITGSIPPAPAAPKRLPLLPLRAVPRRRRAKPTLSPTESLVSLALGAVEPELSSVQAVKGGKPTRKKKDRSSPVPNVRPKALNKLKADLLKADKARAIVADLKRMEVPPDSDSPFSTANGCVDPTHPSSCRGYVLPPLTSSASSSSAAGEEKQPFLTLALPSASISATVSLPATSPGALGGLAAAKTGAFELLADVSGALVRRAGAHEGFGAPPGDRVSVFIYWWGYEVALPPPAIKVLSSVASVQQSFFTFLQAFVVAGGAPELAPLVRYISSYLDMEWSAIRAQNRGKGVVVAATWLLPVALVPRPWDFPPPLLIPPPVEAEKPGHAASSPAETILSEVPLVMSVA
ncbi:hypothetical protein JCM10207_008635 [Rhodosporidiobolus poonsookiae]